MTPFSKRIHEAFDFAAIYHDGQKRKDPDLKIPYTSHLFAVAYMLAQYDFSEDVVIAGVLHDFHEDVIQNNGREDLGIEIKKRFGDEVFRLIDWVTQKKKDAEGQKISWQDRVKAYAQRIADAPVEAKAISCADKIHNIESLLMGFERGIPMWKSLKSTPQEQIKKFRAIQKALSQDWNHPILQELNEKIGALEKWV